MLKHKKPSEEIDYDDFFERFLLVDFTDKMSEFKEM